MQRLIGVISGTSMDALDLAILEHSDTELACGAVHAAPLPESLHRHLAALADPNWQGPLASMAEADAQLGEVIGEAVLQLLAQAELRPQDIRAIGSHGQTVLHRPNAQPGVSLQLGCPHRIAQITGITVVSDFRRRDLAAGGQGAPLVPAFHQAVFGRPDAAIAVLNLGGIANLSLLSNDGSPLRGFDTGPANTLLDLWCRRHRQQPYDAGGTWAASGRVQMDLLAALLDDDFFRASAPKSTGTQYFSGDWLAQKCGDLGDFSAADVQATLLALSAQSIAQALKQAMPSCQELLVCGGGVHNEALMQALAAELADLPVGSTATHGIDPDYVEALAFAWLAGETLAGRPADLMAVTGAKENVILGSIVPGRQGF
ncbi:anhydro-N-acetylmuramic acid kinase [Ectothiorhodosinus mongolicus]|uniref:Anhydro-N-acetylmuramic acid kinase n=1 Tax=Ectothiorhodosinus mongolicus TaxID=233100 RepID=A0A1R3W1H2_9GAMM|nr:anhydro-N-acetylmuramic acid kinase [Ectothiorhodosinus mongolicus]ULX57373.1 anhydro-N-acetylmuramic acid kinase [Ectothiorhodosinus mongolicus]SIT71225.1 anhydro-N-acetylmuramic acid kinase [Ectothiorhodosinus mongolicus]